MIDHQVAAEGTQSNERKSMPLAEPWVRAVIATPE